MQAVDALNKYSMTTSFGTQVLTKIRRIRRRLSGHHKLPRRVRNVQRQADREFLTMSGNLPPGSPGQFPNPSNCLRRSNDTQFLYQLRRSLLAKALNDEPLRSSPESQAG